MKEKGRSSPESLCALGHIVHQGHGLFRYADARQNRWRHRSGLGGSQPLCRHLPIPDSVQAPGPDRHTVCSGFGASPKQASQRPETSPTHTIHPITPGTCGRQEAIPSSPGSSPPRNSPKPRPRFRPTVAAVGWTVPSPRFHPHQGTLSRQPTRPRPAHGLVEPHSLQPSPRMVAQHPQRQGPSYRPHPTPPPRISPLPWNPQQPRIQPQQPLVRADIRSSNNVHNFNGDPVNTLK